MEDETLRLPEDDASFRRFWESLPVGLYRATPDGSFLDVNRDFLEKTGYPDRESLLAAKAEALYADPEDRRRWQALMEREGTVRGFETRLRRADGSVIWVRESARTVCDADGRVACYEGMIEDITERKQAEEALRQSEERYRRLVDLAPDGIVVHSQGRFVFANEAAARILGAASPAEILGRPIIDSVHPDYRGIVAERVRKLAEQGQEAPLIEEKFLRLDGGTVDVEVAAIPFVHDGHPAVQVVVREITERKRAEEDLRASEEKFRSLAEYSPNMIFINSGGRVVYANKKCEEMIGYSRGELYSPAFDFMRLIAPASVEVVKANLERHLRGEDIPPYEYQILTKDGRAMDAIHTTKLIDYEGARAILGIVTDVTERKRAEEALRESEERYRTLFGAVPVPLSVFDAETLAFLAVNQAAVRQYGYSLDEFLGMTPRDLRPPEEVPALLERMAVGDERRGIWRHRRKDGTVFDAEVAPHRLQFRGRPAWLVRAEDVTERRRAERALRESEEQLRALFETMREGFALHEIICDASGRPCDYRFLRANAAFEEVTGLKRAEIIGRTAREVLPEIEPAWIDTYGPVALGGAAVQFERYRGSLGKHFSVVAYSPRKGQFATLFTDITERKRAEEAHARLIRAVEQAGESIVITDTQGKIIYVNPAFERVSGYSGAEALGQNPRILKGGKQGAAFYEELWATIGRGEVWSGHFVNKRKDGTLYEEEATLSPVRDASGTIVNYVAVKRDVTRERRLEDQLLQSQKMEAIGRLAGGVAHDFNNLLGVITGYGDLLLRRLPAEDPSRGKLEQIRKAADRAAALTRQLLAFSRRQVLQPKVLDLNLVVADLDKMLRRLIGEDVALVTALEEGLGCVRADSGQIEQVIMNLAVNARDAMPEGGKLTIETRNVEIGEAYVAQHPQVAPGRYVMLAVSDTGCGMDAETQAHIFEPFFTTKEQGKGTGLGLSTVYGIVKQSGGYIWTYSEVGQGTTFKIYLPGVDEVQGAGEAVARPRPPRGSETILVVEDEEALRTMLQETLEGNGYAVLVAGGGEEALRIAGAHEGRIRLMVTDVVMPGMSGREAAEGVAALQPGILVLYISGYTTDAIVHHGVLGPGTAFLEKPFTPDALLHKVREVLAGAGTQDP